MATSRSQTCQNEQEDDLQSFLERINELESVVSSTTVDDGISKEGKKKKYPPIDNTGVNRTVINKAALKDDPMPAPSLPPGNMDQEAFKAVMEQDCRERYERKKASEKEALALKELGNKEFQKENYKKAIDFYTEALTKIKDMTALWTNRAQTYIKLHQYEKAIEDCDWALRVSEKCVKAYIHKGRAYVLLEKFDEAIDCYNKALKVDPSKLKVIKTYIEEAGFAQATKQEEVTSQAAFEAGDQQSRGVVELLQRVHKSGQVPMYYSGGMRVIASVLNATNERTLFRTSGGLKIITEHPYISRCFNANLRSLSKEEKDLCAAVLEAFTAACVDNEENQKQVLTSGHLTDTILKFLETKLKGTVLLRWGCIRLLYVLSGTKTGRLQVLHKFDMARLLSTLYDLLMDNKDMASNAMSFVSNMALEDRFKSGLRDNIEESLLPTFERLLNDSRTVGSVMPTVVTSMINLAGDAIIRRKMAAKKSLWQACIKLMKTHQTTMNQTLSCDLLHAVLGLLHNMSYETSDNAVTFSKELCQFCLSIVKYKQMDILDRTCTLMSHLLAMSNESLDKVIDSGGPKMFIDLLEDENAKKPALKCLTLCTQNHDKAREIVVKSRAVLTLAKLLQEKDEIVVGNAALCLSHCISTPGLVDLLSNTDTLKDLLILTRDASKKDVKENCAILIAKLCQANTKFLERLRELDGLGILHNVAGRLR